MKLKPQTDSDDRLTFLEQLERVLRAEIRDEMRISLVPYGSVVYGATTSKSDVDATILVHKASDDKFLSAGSIPLLDTVGKILTEKGMNVQVFKETAHPIVKIQKHGVLTPFHVDISANNYDVVHKSKKVLVVLNKHKGIDIATYLKKWTIDNGVNGRWRGMLSSYAWMLLTIEYLESVSKRPTDKKPTIDGLFEFLSKRLAQNPLIVPDKFTSEKEKGFPNCADQIKEAQVKTILKSITSRNTKTTQTQFDR